MLLDVVKTYDALLILLILISEQIIHNHAIINAVIKSLLKASERYIMYTVHKIDKICGATMAATICGSTCQFVE